MPNIRFQVRENDDLNTIIPCPEIMIARIADIICYISIIIFRVIQDTMGQVLIVTGLTKDDKMVP